MRTDGVCRARQEKRDAARERESEIESKFRELSTLQSKLQDKCRVVSSYETSNKADTLQKVRQSLQKVVETIANEATALKVALSSILPDSWNVQAVLPGHRTRYGRLVSQDWRHPLYCCMEKMKGMGLGLDNRLKSTTRPTRDLRAGHDSASFVHDSMPYLPEPVARPR